MGFAEPGAGEAIHNSAAIIDRRGALIGVYRKSHIFVATESFFAPGSDLPVFDMDFGRVAVPICYDLEFPETARVLALRGAEILLTMTAHWAGTGTVGTPENFVRTIYSARALENRLPVVMCNRVGYDPGLDDEFCGLSRIVDSEGMVVAAMDDRSEGMIAATIDLGRWNTPVALFIAVTKAVLVVLFFMHAKYSTRLTWVVALAGVFWLGMLLALTMGDYVTRGWVN